jgi:hypothetical protein
MCRPPGELPLSRRWLVLTAPAQTRRTWRFRGPPATPALACSARGIPWLSEPRADVAEAAYHYCRRFQSARPQSLVAAEVFGEPE